MGMTTRFRGGRLGELNANLRAGGARGGFAWAATQLGASLPPLPAKERPSLPPVRIRYGTTDVHIHTQVADHLQYELPTDAEIGPPRLILDCGAHVGLASAYFARRYPGARVVAIEPHPGNYEVLARNAEGLANVTPVHGAVAAEPGEVEIVDPDAPTWMTRVRPVSSGEPGEGHPTATAYSIAELAERYGDGGGIDILKLDVEGAELGILRRSGEWIDSVGVLLIELHPGLAPGCTEAYEAAVAGASRRWERGETLGALLRVSG